MTLENPSHDSPVDDRAPLRARLHSLTIESIDPKPLSVFYEKTLGLSFSEDRGQYCGSAVDRRLNFVRGTSRRLAQACFLVDSVEALQALKYRLTRFGTLFTESSTKQFGKSLSVTDLDGNPLVFAYGFHPLAPVAESLLSQRAARLQHFVLGSANAARLIEFYVNQLGFLVSDTVYDDAGIVRTAFLNCSKDHHSVAIFATGENRLDHFCFETGDWGLIRDWSDHFASQRIPLKWGPGRHGPGNNLFVFIHDLEGNWVELSAELEQIAPQRPAGTWKHEERTLNSWGEGRLRS